MKSFKDAEKVAKVLKNLSHPLRLKILCCLLKKDLYAGDITECLGTTKGNISQHLNKLLEQSFIQRQRIANRHLYSIKDQRVGQLIETIALLYKTNCKRGDSL